MSEKISKKLPRRSVLAGAALTLGMMALGPAALKAQSAPIVVKMGTLAPEGSPWYKVLRSMGEEWEKLSAGRVKLKLYPGGVSGNEGQMLKKMRIGQLHAASFTSTGLIDIDRGSMALQAPMTISSYEEYDFVLSKLGPTLEKRIEDKGFKVMGWGDVGWVHFFTKTPVSTVDELKRSKMYAWSGDPEATAAFVKLGLKPVTVDATDVLMSLQTGMIESFPSTPLAALSLQWFGLAKNMVDVPWSPMVGATIISKKTWDQIPAELQPKIQAAAKKATEELKKQVRTLDRDAIEVMKKSGLKVIPVSNKAEWKAFADSFVPHIRGTVMSADMLDEVQRLHKEYISQVKK